MPLHQDVSNQHEHDEQGQGKGVISLLQEFVQCSRQFHAPQHRPILQWSYDNRMADFATLEFRATVAFLLDGVPHHVAGAWFASKKIAQRDTAERALSFFVGRWGEQLFCEQETPPPELPVRSGSKSDAEMLEEFCRTYSACDDKPLEWSHASVGSDFTAQVEISLLGVPHKFAGSAKASPSEAYADVARRVLWYFECPGYEGEFAPDPNAAAVVGKEIPAPPANWASDAMEGSAVLMAERKTALMRVQNRLQQTYARHLRPGQSVWEWTYENDENDSSWPCLCRATVHVPVARRSFTGDWVRGSREAQIDACLLVAKFLDGVEEKR